MERGVPIRSISRCIAVLQCINRNGSLSLTDVARLSKLPYPTACRIIQTLMHEGLIECEPTRKHYRATALVHTLSQGFHNHDKLVDGARAFIVQLTRRVGWPVAITTRVGHSMIVRDTTHHLTSLTLNLDPPGFTLPLLECACGQVYLAHAEDGERISVIEALERLPTRSSLLPLFKSARTIARIREDGYVIYERTPHASSPGKISSIAVPIHEGPHAIGALTLVFFTSAMPMPEALQRYLADMKETAASISRAISTDDEIDPLPGSDRTAGLPAQNASRPEVAAPT